jgi:hypothetical protein
VLDVVERLTAALKASEEQNGAIRRGLDWERAEREKVAEFARKIGRERDEFTAANLAANKRIVELEHERDAARAELTRLTTPRPIAEAPRDGTWVIGIWEKGPLWEKNPKMAEAVAWEGDDSGCWLDESGNTADPTHYLPLPEVKP